MKLGQARKGFAGGRPGELVPKKRSQKLNSMKEGL